MKNVNIENIKNAQKLVDKMTQKETKFNFHLFFNLLSTNTKFDLEKFDIENLATCTENPCTLNTIKLFILS